MSRIRNLKKKKCIEPVRTSSEFHPASYTMGTASSSGVKRSRCVKDRTNPSRAEFEERLELYFSFPSGPSWSVLGSTSEITYQLEERDFSFQGTSYLDS